MRFFKIAFGFAVKTVLRLIACLWPRDHMLVAIGAWGGRSYSDNSKYFAEYLLEHSDFRVVWIGNKEVGDMLPNHSRMDFVVKDTYAANLVLLRAGTWICCQSVAWDLTGLPLWGFAKIINLWHGSGPKKMGRNAPWRLRHPEERHSLIFNLYSAYNRPPIPWTLTPSDCLVDVLVSGEPEHFRRDRTLRFGTPRNDFLLKNKGNDSLKKALREKYAKMIGFDSVRKIVLYLPTWRMSNAPVFSFYGLADNYRNVIAEILRKENAVLVEKHHVKTLERDPVKGVEGPSIVIPEGLFPEIDIQELLLIADVLITEYSSAYIDFALQGRPCLHFAYDLEYYENEDQGIAYDYERVVGGKIVRTIESLLQELGNALKSGVQYLGVDFNMLVKYETGTACEQLLRFIEGDARAFK